MEQPKEQSKQEQSKQNSDKQPKQTKQNKKATASKKIDLSKLEKPEFIEHRIKVWDEYKKKNQGEKKAEEKAIKVTLPDGKSLEAIAFKTSPFDIAMGISKGLANSSVVAKVNGELRDLTRPLEEDCTLELLKFDSEEAKKVFWHSSSHVMGQAMELLFNCNLCVGPPLQDGFFYDAQMGDRVITSEDFEVVQDLVKKISSEEQPFERMVVPKEVALEMFKFNKYKSQILKEKVPENGFCSVYRCGNLIDPCKGPHLPNTARVKAFKVTKNSSAYWQGKAENDSLQRLYGISFPENKLLKEWEDLQAIIAERDHRVIGKNQELFFFHPLSPGSCFFLPHGARIYNKLMEMIRSEYRNRGFTEVVTPNMFSTQLWQTSGHWDNYKENMFSFKVEDQDFALKPMNCPGHCVMFGHRMRSYRELPIRFADFGVLHRNEYSGALTGLTRVRRFQQDDAHIFCAADQIKQEITGALQFMDSVYGRFGFDYSLELSTRPEKYLGELSLWDKAEKQLEEVLNEFKESKGKSWKMNPGDGAFYGPKIDIHIKDALGRSHQCATVQLDFQLPLRFKLQFMGEKSDELSTPVIIHRAILGSVERFMANLIEHTGGKWPFWISPRQIIVCGISEKVHGYVEEVRKTLHDAGYFVDVELSDKTIDRKIREAQLAQYNYILVVGAKEQEEKSVNVRTRDNQVHGTKKLDDVLQEMAQLVKDFK